MADEEKLTRGCVRFHLNFMLFQGIKPHGLTEQQINAGGPTIICPTAKERLVLGQSKCRDNDCALAA